MDIDILKQSPKAIISKIEKFHDKLSGHEKFLILSIITAKADKNKLLHISQAKEVWERSSCGKYNAKYYERAETNDWVFPNSNISSYFTITDNGINHFNFLANIQNLNLKEIRKTGSLIIVNKKGTYSFDFFLREIIKKAKNKVIIADSYVDETLFDNHLHVVPSNVIIKVLYGSGTVAFATVANRFQAQYQKFEFLQYKDLHDRFIIIDDIAYILGPSIKDAATNSPAIVVALNSLESKFLEDFFMELWKISKEL